jgi:hypothetical protein
MKVQYVMESIIDNYIIDLYKEKTSKLTGVIFNGPMVGIDKRIVSIRLGDVDSELILVNPKITNTSNDLLIYYEKDYRNLKKIRKTKRYKSIVVETDNLGFIEFKPTSETGTWLSKNDFFEDVGLFECVLAQRVIDSINGIDINHSTVKYNDEIRKPKKIGRNDKIMMQSADGSETVFIKNKKSDYYLDRGFKIV